MKKLLVLLALFAVLAVLTGCDGISDGMSDGKRITTAKIRYFDGSMDTLEIDRWRSSSSGYFILYTAEGRTVVIGANNVILIEETEEQYNH